MFINGGVTFPVGDPLGLAFDNGGNLFVSDLGGGHIYKVDRQGNVGLFATPGHSPAGVAFDGAGNLYVARNANGDILRYDTNGVPTTFATFLYPNNTPYGLAFDSFGNLYVSTTTSGSPMIYKVDPQGNKTVFASAATRLTGTGFLVIQETRYQDNWNKVAGGGGTSTNAEFLINGTVGQQDAWTAMTGGQFGMVGGFWARISLVPTPGAPELAITLTTTNTAMVSWPSPSTGWNLQQNTDLGTVNWVTPAETVNNNGSIKYIIINPPTGNRFYRLMQWFNTT